MRNKYYIEDFLRTVLHPLSYHLSRRQVWRWGLLAVITVLVSVMAGQWAERRELQLQSKTLQHTAQLYAQAVKGLIENHNHLPNAVSKHPDVLALLTNPAGQTLVNRVNHYLSDLQKHNGQTALYVISKTGMILAASTWNTAPKFVGHSYNQRPYIRDALLGRRNSIYSFGLISRIHGLVTIEPVWHGKQVIGAVALKVIPEALERTWSDSATPVILRDDRGIIFLTSVSDWLFRSSRQLAADELAELIRSSQYGERSSFDILPWRIERTGETPAYLLHTTLQNRPASFLAMDIPLPELGWTLTVTSDLAEVQSTHLGTIFLTATVLLLGGLYWQLRNRRFSELRQHRLNLEQRVQQRTQAIEEHNAFRRAMDNSLPVGIGVSDPDWRIMYVNPAFCTMVGYSAEELLGLQPPYPFWLYDREHLENSPALRGNAGLDGYESRFIHRDGHEVIGMIYTAPLVDAQGGYWGWMSSVVDITAQRQAESRQQAQEQQLQRSAHLASLGEIATTMAHELNQPLMALSNFALAARTIASREQQPLLTSALDDIVTQAQRASDIVKRIRNLINTRRGTYETCDIHSILADTLTMLRPELQRHQTHTKLQLAETLPQLRADPILLQQVLINLMQNAMQAMQDMPPAQRVIDIITFRIESSVQIQIGDHGPGIPDALQKKMFEPFFSTKADGLGLGLNICHTIIEAHGGSLQVTNHAEGGAIFFFSLPLTP